MITLSYKNPWGYLVAAGIKDIENRTWKLPEKHKGQRVLIHVSAKPVPMKHESDVFTYAQWWQGLTLDQRILMQSNSLVNGAIIGSVEFVDCVINHPSIWAEHWVTKPWHNGVRGGTHDVQCHNWVLANPVLFAKPITNVKGKLSFWDYPIELCHICGQPTEFICKVCERPYCENHQANFNQFTQIDYNCCSDCADSKKLGE